MLQAMANVLQSTDYLQSVNMLNRIKAYVVGFALREYFFTMNRDGNTDIPNEITAALENVPVALHSYLSHALSASVSGKIIQTEEDLEKSKALLTNPIFIEFLTKVNNEIPSSTIENIDYVSLKFAIGLGESIIQDLLTSDAKEELEEPVPQEGQLAALEEKPALQVEQQKKHLSALDLLLEDDLKSKMKKNKTLK